MGRDVDQDAVFIEKHVRSCHDRALKQARMSDTSNSLLPPSVRAAGWCIGGDEDGGLAALDRCQLHGGEVVWSYHEGRIYRGVGENWNRGEGCLTLDYARRLFHKPR